MSKVFDAADFNRPYISLQNSDLRFCSNFRDISIQVLGYWFWWLFIVPSLRSRRPKGPEKKALDIAFLGTPLISILAPVATKDTGLIWLGEFKSLENLHT